MGLFLAFWLTAAVGFVFGWGVRARLTLACEVTCPHAALPPIPHPDPEADRS